LIPVTASNRTSGSGGVKRRPALDSDPIEGGFPARTELPLQGAKAMSAKVLRTKFGDG
jgi:hypothetical protein